MDFIQNIGRWFEYIWSLVKVLISIYIFTIVQLSIYVLAKTLFISDDKQVSNQWYESFTS